MKIDSETSCNYTSTWGYLMHSTNDGQIKRLWFPRCGFCLKNNVFVAGTPRRASWREVFKTPGLATWVLHMAIGTSWEINGNYMCGTFNLSSDWSQILLRMGCALKKTMQWVWVFVLCEFWDAQIRSQIGEHLSTGFRLQSSWGWGDHQLCQTEPKIQG